MVYVLWFSLRLSYCLPHSVPQMRAHVGDFNPPAPGPPLGAGGKHEVSIFSVTSAGHRKRAWAMRHALTAERWFPHRDGPLSAYLRICRTRHVSTRQAIESRTHIVPKPIIHHLAESPLLSFVTRFGHGRGSKERVIGGAGQPRTLSSAFPNAYVCGPKMPHVRT